MKKILGLDLGTNSIGWALVNAEFNTNADDKSELKYIGIEAAGSRIIPMDASVLSDFDKGVSKSQTSERTKFRSSRRLRERHLLRRDRLNRVLDILGFLPDHYSNELNRYGKIKNGNEPKVAWRKSEAGQFHFVFNSSFNEMLEDFKKHQPSFVTNGKKVPYDWTIYYLRNKALTNKITKEELAWLLLNFNQKRGYYQLRGEEEEDNANKLVEFYALKVISVEDSGEKKGKDIWYNVLLENGWIYRRTSSFPLDWIGKTKEFIVTTDIESDGTPKKDKEGNIKRSFRAPKEEDWTLLKKKTEHDIETSKKTVGSYIYENLLNNPTVKIKGKLVRTIERKYYKNELIQILEKQKEFHNELSDVNLYNECINNLYANNYSHCNNIANRGFTYLLIDDIIFYQRPLKSKKSLVANCPFEDHTFKDENGNYQRVPYKCIAKSHPLFQEFRLWQFVSNLRIFQREIEINGKLETDVDVTPNFLKSESDYVRLFEWLNDRKEIDQKAFLKFPAFDLKRNADGYRWNYVEDKAYPCNETRSLILYRLNKSSVSSEFLTPEILESLWHILYSVDDKHEIEKALITFAKKHQLTDAFVENFKKFPPFKKEYGSFSAKATRKMLTLMRMGTYWNENLIDEKSKNRIEKIIDGEFDEKIHERVREKAINLKKITHFKGLPVWLASYVIYDRHSESKDILKWSNPSDIDEYLKSFKQHSLRNPIVEQIIIETLRTVRDIWKQAEQIDEIHVELGREMKNPADKRAKITQQIQDNENTNLRIKAMLAEFVNPEYRIENVRPYSPSQQDCLRIYEEFAISNLKENDGEYDFVSKISTGSQPSKSDILRYKLWLEQQYRSPYTGRVIPLGKLFTPAYEIEHVIPQARYFDDSFSNKVICEAEVNSFKGNSLAYEFIKNNPGVIINLGFGENVTLFSVSEYEEFVRSNYSKTRNKMKKLLMDEIPDQFIERQLNDSRYISKVVKSLLSNIVREKDEKGEYEIEAVSKNLITCNGTITDRLKREWGMNDVWNRIVLPRFKRLNELTNSSNFTTLNSSNNEIPSMPLELQKGFNKKRIDHRHHAMDAIVIACATRDHVNLLNNEAAKAKNNANRYQLSRKLRKYEKVNVIRNGEHKEIEVAKDFFKPWESFTQDAYNALYNIIASFKQNLRVLNKTTNYFQHFENGKKVVEKQSKGDSWAIRKPMHKDTVFGEVNLRKIKTVSINEALKQPKEIVNKEFKAKIQEFLSQNLDPKKIKKYFEDNKDVWSDVNLARIEVYYFTKDTKERFFATRKPLDTSFDRKKIEESITDTGIQKILLRHLENKENNPEYAFSADGIDEMNRNILLLNNGKSHQPISKVRVYEKADKFAVGQLHNKSLKFVESAKGTNLFFAIYLSDIEDTDTGEKKQIRSYATISLNKVIDCQKKGGKDWETYLDKDLKENEIVSKNCRLLFILSPNELVYLPTKEQIKNGINSFDKKRIYKLVSCTGNEGHFVPAYIANSIIQTIELGSNNKSQRAWTNEMIKEICIPLNIDRLGNISM